MRAGGENQERRGNKATLTEKKDGAIYEEAG